MIDNNVIEKIVYNVISDNWLDSHFIMKKGELKPKLDEYRIDIRVRRVYEVGDIINVNFQIKLINYKNSDDIMKEYTSLNIDKNTYKQFMREEKLKGLAVTPEDKIRKSLSEYLEFDSDELFKSKFNLVRVFGGAIRDTIAEQSIHDVDILCGSKALKYIESILEQNGYQYMKMLNGKDLQEMYSEIHIINEPHTWVKGKKIVQLIRPSLGSFLSSVVNADTIYSMDEDIYKQGFKDLISNVDLSCCGVSYDGETLYEDYPNAIIHCQSKVYSVNNFAKMYSRKRIHHRTAKLENRGWKQVENVTNVNRDMKIERIFGYDL
jgi:hypothetical protein